MLRQDGFNYEFDPAKCDECGGRCCTGESGYIWISDDEIAVLADFLGISQNLLKERFLFKTKRGYSIKECEFQGGFACVFFDKVKKNCSVYEARPSQCKTFPFWEHFKNNLRELQAECIGVNLL